MRPFASTVCSIMLLLMLVLLPTTVGKVYEIKNSWDTGFQGEINIPVKEDIEYGWKLEIKFHRPIERFECWAGKLQKAEQGESGSNYHYTNFEYNKILKRGKTLRVEFNGAFIGNSGPEVPPITIKFQHKIIYSEHYDLASDWSTVSTTDIVYVLDSLTKESVVDQPRPRPTNRPPPTINEITDQNPSRARNPDNMNEINNRNNQRLEEINNRNSGEQQSDTNEEERNFKGEIKDNVPEKELDYDMGSGYEPSSTPAPGRRPARRTKYPYIRAIQKSLLFYEAQRSGKLPADNRIQWRGDSAMTDKGQNGEDLTGGYYDAGDHMKFGFPMAFSMTTLAWGVIEYWEAYQQAAELENALQAIKWGVDYILKSYVGRYEFYGQVGLGKKDHDYWGRPEELFMQRPAFKITAKKPGSDLAAESSAALSAAAIAFERYGTHSFASKRYLQKLRTSAVSLYDFATRFKGKYSKAIKDAELYYPSTNFLDEIVWAAAWLYRTTGREKYLTEAEGKYQNWGMFKLPEKFMFSWDDKTVGIQVLLSQVTGGAKSDSYVNRASAYCKEMRVKKSRYTPKGLLYMDDWSPLRYSANIAFICQLTADQGGDRAKNNAFAQEQIHYMLGDTGRSYVVGFGRRYPKFPHHRASSCSGQSCGWQAYQSQKPNPNILQGALVGGPDKKDNFDDNRKNFKSSEVSLDHNSCFQGAVAGLLQQSMLGVPPNNRSHEPWYDHFITSTTGVPSTTTSRGSSSSIKGYFSALVFFACLLVSIRHRF